MCFFVMIAFHTSQSMRHYEVEDKLEPLRGTYRGPVGHGIA